MKKFLFTALLLSPAGLLSTQTCTKLGCTVGLAAGQESKVIVHPGDKIEVIITEEPNAQYRWHIVPTASLDDAFGKGIISKTEKSEPIFEDGSIYARRYIFNAVEQGSGILGFEYQRDVPEKKEHKTFKQIITTAWDWAKGVWHPAKPVTARLDVTVVASPER